MAKRLLFSFGMCAICVCVLACFPKPATAGESVLDEVAKRGTIRVGVMMDMMPSGGRDAKGTPIGRDIDWANELAKEMKVKLELIETTSPNRIPTLLSGKIDVLIAGLAVTMERAMAVEFTDPYMRSILILLARKESGITKLDDLKQGKHKLGFVRGTNPDVTLTPILKQWKFPDGNISRYDSNAEVLLALKQKKVDVLAEAENWCLVQAKEDPNLIPVYPPYKSEFAALAVRRGDQTWLNFLNQFVFYMNESGKTAEIFQKWYNKPGPPRLNPELPVIH